MYQCVMVSRWFYSSMCFSSNSLGLECASIIFSHLPVRRRVNADRHGRAEGEGASEEDAYL